MHPNYNDFASINKKITDQLIPAVLPTVKDLHRNWNISRHTLMESDLANIKISLSLKTQNFFDY